MLVFVEGYTEFYIAVLARDDPRCLNWSELQSDVFIAAGLANGIQITVEGGYRAPRPWKRDR